MPEIRLRREIDADLGFLKDLYATSREREMSLLQNWTQLQQREFLDAQFTAQYSSYHQRYPDARYDLVLCDERAIGRLYVASLESELVLMDISLLPAQRNAGIGTRLCKQVVAEGTQQGKVISLHVADENPARRLYDKLGFVEIAAVTFYKLMHWVPPGLQHVSDELAAEITN